MTLTASPLGRFAVSQCRNTADALIAERALSDALADALQGVCWHLDARLMARPDDHAQEAHDAAEAALSAYDAARKER